jgi:signal transduction histidine kinase
MGAVHPENPVFSQRTRDGSIRRVIQSEGRLSLRVLFLLGFAGIFLIWLMSAYLLVLRMADADSRGSAMRSRFLHNEQLLSTVRAHTLLSSVYLRDALLDTTRTSVSVYQDRLDLIRQEIARALGEYVPRVASETERLQWQQLQNEIDQYWISMLPVLELERPPTAVEARLVVRDELIPKRETIIRISDAIHAMNEHAFEQEQSELAALREALRRRVWQTSTIGVLLGLGIALLAARYAGRLESRIRDQHQCELRQKQQLAQLSSQLMQAQEEERRRIARELHDEIGQALTAMKLELAIAARSAPASVAGSLQEARVITDRTLQSIRDMSQLLHPSMLDDLGLPDTATWYLRGFSRRTGITSDLVVDRLDRRLDPELESCTYRIIQEALTNVARHAAASRCRVEIAQLPSSLRISVEDNGKGFDPAVASRPPSRGFGLVSVRERVTRLGGTLNVESKVGAGTRLLVDLPVPDGAEA